MRRFFSMIRGLQRIQTTINNSDSPYVRRVTNDRIGRRVRDNDHNSYFPSTENASRTLPGMPPKLPYPELT